MVIPVNNMPQYDLYLIAAQNSYAILAGFDGAITAIRNISIQFSNPCFFHIILLP